MKIVGLFFTPWKSFERICRSDSTPSILTLSKTDEIRDNEMYLGGGQTEIEQEQTRFRDEILQEQTRISEEINKDLEQLATVEETFGFWLSRRKETIKILEDIATYIDSFTKKASVAKAIGKVIDTKCYK